MQKDLPSRQLVHACTHMDSCTELWAQHAVAGWFTTPSPCSASLFFPKLAFAHQMYCIYHIRYMEVRMQNGHKLTPERIACIILESQNLSSPI
jgi:hypothetical protein